MKIFNNLANLPAFRRAVLTIGSFDGVHAGHQQLLARINQLAQTIDGESVLITFEPHPRIALGQATHLRLLTTISEKIRLLADYGVDNLVVVPFLPEFSRQSPEEYIRHFLVERFQPRYIVIGYDHRFGAHRAGDISYLRRFEKALGFEVLEIGKHEVDDIAVSSTKVRAALESGDLATANQLLHHAFLMEGEVVHGDKIGTQLGFPTANLRLASPYKLIPPAGIYAVFVQRDRLGTRHAAMLYIGNRPTVQGTKRNIEVHLFDFSDNLYGETLCVEFIARTRDDQRFESLDALKTQLQEDEKTVRALLATK